ncbi:MAG: aspartyl protease family protein [Halioglobus sp.]|jgi:aspartyl protease family protein
MNTERPAKKDTGISTAMTVLAWISFMALLGFYFSDLLDNQNNPNQNLSTQYTAGQFREVTLQRNRQGHYVTNGRLNGQPVVFMLDTGASGVAIPGPIARQLDIKRGTAHAVHTANGTGTAYATRLQSVSVGEIVLENVPASIVPGYVSGEVLLGMSFLKHVDFTQRGDTLILKQAIDGS